MIWITRKSRPHCVLFIIKLFFYRNKKNMVLAVQVSIGRLAATLCFYTMESLYDWIKHDWKKYGIQTEVRWANLKCDAILQYQYPLGWALMLSAATCLLSLLCAMVLAYMDRRRIRFEFSRSASFESKSKDHYLLHCQFASVHLTEDWQTDWKKCYI